MKSPSVTDLRSYFLSIARYHVWATARLYEKVDALSDEEYRRDAGLFFKSVHGTLNHLVVAEHRVWYPRFAEGQSNRIALNLEVEKDRARLRALLFGLGGRWQPLIESFPPERFLATLDYRTTRGVPQSLPFAPTLGHVFNHATHHRGQITTAIRAMGREPPELDMVIMLQAESKESPP